MQCLQALTRKVHQSGKGGVLGAGRSSYTVQYATVCWWSDTRREMVDPDLSSRTLRGPPIPAQDKLA
jgi:hypothetical protein